MKKVRFWVYASIFLAGILCFALSRGFSSESPSAVTTHLTILYDNDVHGHLIPFDDSRSGKDIGGAARRDHLMKEFKKENPNTLILDAGDWLSGTPISGLFKGEADWGTFERMPYDAIVIGNHDFDYGQEELRNLIKTSKIPVLSANILDTKTNKLFATPYIIKTIDGIKVAILGLTTPTTPIITQPANVTGLKFEDVKATAEKYLPELKKKADLVIFLTHLGFREDLQLAKQVNGIDIIVGGHSHTKVDHYEKSGNTVVVQDFQWGINLGKMDLTLVDKKIVDAQANLIPVTSKIPEDKQIAEYLKPYVDKIAKKMKTVVGKTEVDLVKPSYSNSQTNLADWLCDVFKARLNADIAMMNTGGVRASLNKGNITYNDIFSILPFENNLVLLEAPGSLVEDIMNQLAYKIANKQETGSVSGVTFDIVGGDARNIKIDGKPFNGDKVYTIAVNDFMANGGSGYSLLKKAKVEHYDANLRDIVIDYLKQHPIISPTAEERFKLIR